MANKFSKGHVFVPGEVVDPDDLNNLVDLALALPPLITDQTSVNATTGDKVLVSRAGVLKQADVSTFPSGTTSVDFASGNPAPTTIFSGNVSPTTGDALITLGLKNQGANKVLVGPVSGSATPTFRVLSPVDLPVATISIALADIDWNLGSMFTKTLTNNITFAFSNASPGQTIRVRVVQDVAPGLRTVTWPVGVRWPGGTNPVMSTGAGKVDIYTFHYIGTLYYGTFDQNFLT